MNTKTVWCDECKIKVYDCDHLRRKDASIAAEVPPDVSLEPGKHELVFLAFNGTVPGEAWVTLATSPQLDVKPMRLVVDPAIASSFMLMDIKIGCMSNFAAASGGGVACGVFPPTPPKYQPVANLAGLPIVKTGQAIILSLRNRNHCALEFSALVWCAVVKEKRKIDFGNDIFGDVDE